MAFTGHGHLIPGTLATGKPPQQKSRCGGPGACEKCQEDSRRHLNRMNKLDDAIRMLITRGYPELDVLKIMVELYRHNFMIIDRPEGFDIPAIKPE
jgi:hypothetical protein